MKRGLFMRLAATVAAVVAVASWMATIARGAELEAAGASAYNMANNTSNNNKNGYYNNNGNNSNIDKQQLPAKVVEEIMAALHAAGGYASVALMMPFLQQALQARVTLLVPSDEALGLARLPTEAGGVLGGAPVLQLARYHALRSNLSFHDLLKLPASSLLPTLLDGARLEITNSSSRNFSFDHVSLQSPDICPPRISSFVTCHGISRLLSPPSSASSSPSSSPSASPTSSCPKCPSLAPRSMPAPSPSPSPSLATQSHNLPASSHASPSSIRLIPLLLVAFGAYVVFLSSFTL